MSDPARESLFLLSVSDLVDRVWKSEALLREAQAALTWQQTKDWTQGADGRSNTSAMYLLVVDEVERILNNHSLGQDVVSTARLIVSQLAHRLHLAPPPAPPEAP